MKKLKPYESNAVPGCIRLDANENPLPWPEGMKEKLYNTSIPLNRYPDGNALELRKALAEYTGIPVEGVLTGNGSDELIQLIMGIYGGEGRKVVIHPPTFSMYGAAAQVTGTEVIEVPLVLEGERLTLDVEGILREARESSVKIIIICNPNNPTGTVFPREDILRIVAETGKIVVVDEAYCEFAGVTLSDEIANHPNLLIFRTFSKLYGMAALRLGYVLGDPRTIEIINRGRQPFNVNSFTQKAGVLALQYAAEYEKQKTTLLEEMDKIIDVLNSFPQVKVYPTQSNFVLFQVEETDRVYEELLKRGLQIRNMGNLPVLGKSLRLSAGLPEENQRLIKALKAILAQE
ncbi:MAG: histidinol-phosphate transaminase [Desulfitobacterium sp.]|nr:histidinol-phosphate transaminase [Desulfitobacterium sp.]